MKIIPENIINTNKDILRKQPQNKGAAVSENVAKASDYDKITIGSKPDADVTDAQLISQLKKGILAEIQAGAPEHKLAGLKQQIALDEYDVNIPDIIRKIMLDAEVNYE